MNKTMQDTLLVELFTEELPPKALKRLGDAFAEGVATRLKKAGLIDDANKLEMFATPRRLAVKITNVRAVAPDQAFAEKLMPVTVGLDKEGKATPALTKKLAARSLAHVDVATLARESDGKVDQLVYRGTAPGQALRVALQTAVAESLAALPVPKVMSYQLADGATTVQFVRPAHGLIALHGSEIVPISVLGLTAGRVTHGHRFQGDIDIPLANANDYPATLESRGGVIASFDKRKEEIERELVETAQLHGAALGPREDYAALLDEVTALVERPTVYVGAFETEFLAVPAECLILTMKLNQKYFPLFDRGGKLTNQFLIVSNLRLDNPHNIVEGNQRVVRPRLSDARFFFEADKKTKLEERLPKLASVVYHNRLGSQGERVTHVRAIAKAVAALTSNDLSFSNDVDIAARFAKADLVTDMVGEFPELQGTMGKYYALHEGISAKVADAIEDHYKPRFAGDSLPDNDVGVIVALADKLATLAGMFSIGQLPTGDKDPFALRRHAIGVVRLLVEKQLSIDVSALVDAAAKHFNISPPVPNNPAVMEEIRRADAKARAESAAKLTTFLFERFGFLLREQNYTALEVEAVLSLRPERLDNVPDYLKAVRAFSALPEAASLAAANKRISNILKKSESVPAEYYKNKMQEKAELSLAEAAEKIIPKALELFELAYYETSLCQFAKLREPLDIFFDQVMVNSDDPDVRKNRLGLLAKLHREMNKFADLSKLVA
jgi:glycyl-tRNA synthetase beta chain